MQGRFIFENFDPKDSKILLQLLKELPIVTEPRVPSPLNNILDTKEIVGTITRADLRKGLVFKVNQEEIPTNKLLIAYVVPLETPMYQGVMNYNLRYLANSGWKVTEFWGRDQMVLLETRKGNRNYKIGLHAKENF